MSPQAVSLRFAFGRLIMSHQSVLDPMPPQDVSL
jgi:hypothetical protein